MVCVRYGAAQRTYDVPGMAADAERMDLALNLAKIILENAGFKVMERIVLKNKRTGKIFR